MARPNNGPTGGATPTPGPPSTPTAKQQARERRQEARQRKRQKAQRRAKRAAWQAMYDPSQTISGIPLRQLANALTRLELQPGIKAQKAALAASRRGQRYDVGALGRMGSRLDQQQQGLVSRLGGYRGEAVSRAEAARDRMNQSLTNTAQQSTDRLNTLQGQVLGEQISTLNASGVQPGQSATDRAMGQFAQGQQDALTRQRESWQGLAGLMGEQGINLSGQLGDAAVYGAEADRSAISRNIASRIADRRQMGAEERAASRAELATLRGLRGSTRLKNLMELRREQQDFGARKAEIAAQRQQWKAENAREWYDSVTRRQDSQNDGGGDGDGRGANDTPRRMTGAEWQDWKSVGKEIIESNPGKRITNWPEFLDAIASSEGVSWTPRERAKFKRRFQKWYNQNY